MRCYFCSESAQTHNDGRRFFCENLATKTWDHPIYEISETAKSCPEFIPLDKLARVTQDGAFVAPGLSRWGDSPAEKPRAKPIEANDDLGVERKWKDRIIGWGSVTAFFAFEAQEIIAQITRIFHHG
jgi:hypothetical protein